MRNLTIPTTIKAARKHLGETHVNDVLASYDDRELAAADLEDCLEDDWPATYDYVVYHENRDGY